MAKFKLIHLAAVICGLFVAVNLHAQENQTQLGAFAQKVAGTPGFCDSIYTYGWNGSSWAYTGAQSFSTNPAGYISRLAQYDSSNNLQYINRLIYNGANRPIRGSFYIYFAGFGYLEAAYVSTDTTSAGRIVREHFYQVDSTGANYSEVEQAVYTYDKAGRMVGKHQFTNTGSSWMELNLDSFSYNSSGQLSTDSVYAFDYSSGKLELQSRYTYTYNSKGKLTDKLQEDWDGGMAMFMDAYRYKFAYDASGRRTASYEENFDNSSFSWVDASTDSTTFDASGYATTISYSYNSGWEPTRKEVCAYSSSVSAPKAPSGLTVTATKKTNDKKLTLSWADNSSNENGFIIMRSDNGTSNWVIVDSAGVNTTSYVDTSLAPATTYYYKVGAWNNAGIAFSNMASSTTFTSVDGILAGVSVNIYPNPSHGIINLNFEGVSSPRYTLVITDALGHLVYSSGLAGNARNITADLSDVPNGIYILSLKGENLNLVKRISIEK